ncbi:hypothetical protein DRN74_00395 [Candidatus Micrarchaeota archaeon]|nr:MAG: hypothetical protein DRN74_00395 [Candidatus Micrarchaeota archaeon]
MKSGKIFIMLLPIVLLFMLLFLLPTVISDTATARVDVGNTAPTISNVKLIDWGTADDNQIGDSMTGHEYNYRVACNFTVTDINGVSDIKVPEANLTITGIYAADDADVHYSNNSCIYNYTSGTNELTFSCLFRIQYYADNGTWKCHVAVQDQGGSRDNATDTAKLVALTSVVVNTSSPPYDVLDFGSMAANSNSSSANSLKIINIGNTNLDIQISGTNMTNTTLSTHFFVENITYNRTYYVETKKGSKTANPNTVPRRLQESSYTWDINIRDRDDADSDFTVANKTAQFRIIIPAGQTAALYRNTITVNGQYGG